MGETNRQIRIAVTADLHYDPSGQLTSKRRIKLLVDEIRRETPDAVVIAGDLAHGLKPFQGCLALFSDFDVPIAVLAGNHDVWADKMEHHSSSELWNNLLPDATRNANAVWLEAENVYVGEIAIVGSMIWYDYSAIDPGLNFSVEEITSAKERLNNDARWIDWAHSDPDFANTLIEGLRLRLDTASANPRVREIVLVTHVPIFEEQILRKPHDPQWGLSNSYFGNLTAGDMVRNYDKVRTVISGHTHVGRQGLLRRNNGAMIETYVVPSEYGKPAYALIEV